ncbi:hypothetical protein, partial [Actinoalloteichus spitiensis]|uniref:hypothetical protein n=1 Tax=Actinoalloteichus spitiensis TaxID=252394 RepID=UPI000474E311
PPAAPADRPAGTTTGQPGRDRTTEAGAAEDAEDEGTAAPARQQPVKPLAAQSAKKNRARARSRRPAKSRR